MSRFAALFLRRETLSCKFPAANPSSKGGPMFRKHAWPILMSGMLLALPLPASSQSKDQLVEKYTALAGSEASATSLVTGLRDDKEVDLAGTKFTPPTDKMGY